MDEQASPTTSDRRRKPSIQVLVNPFIDDPEGGQRSPPADANGCSPSVHEDSDDSSDAPDSNVFTFDKCQVEMDDDLSAKDVSKIANAAVEAGNEGIVRESNVRENSLMQKTEDDAAPGLCNRPHGHVEEVANTLRTSTDNAEKHRENNNEVDISEASPDRGDGQRHSGQPRTDQITESEGNHLTNRTLYTNYEDKRQEPTEKSRKEASQNDSEQSHFEQVRQKQLKIVDEHPLNDDQYVEYNNEIDDESDMAGGNDTLEGHNGTSVDSDQDLRGRVEHAKDKDKQSDDEQRYDSDEQSIQKTPYIDNQTDYVTIDEYGHIRKPVRVDHHQHGRQDQFNTNEVYGNEQINKSKQLTVDASGGRYIAHDRPHRRSGSSSLDAPFGRSRSPQRTPSPKSPSPPDSPSLSRYLPQRSPSPRRRSPPGSPSLRRARLQRSPSPPTYSPPDSPSFRRFSPQRSPSPKSDQAYICTIPEYVPLNRRRAGSPIPASSTPPTASHRCESPVMRRARIASPSTAHKLRRKISSDARLGPSEEQLKWKLPPRRKVSSEARLGAYYRPQANVNVSPLTQEPKTRRVSFETHAYICGDHPAPLNDERFHVVHTPTYEVRRPAVVPETIISEIHGESQSENDLTLRDSMEVSEGGSMAADRQVHEEAGLKMNIPKITLGESTESLSSPEDNESLCSGGTLHREHLQGYDNHGYDSNEGSPEEVSPQVYQEERTHYSNRQGITNEDTNIDHSEQLPEAPRRLIVYDADYARKLEATRYTGTSDTSLTGGSPRRQSLQSYDENGLPRSILKRKESAVSNDSTIPDSKLSMKLRKDSVALFNAKHSDVESLQKRMAASHKRFSSQEIKRIWQNRGNFVEKHKLHLLVFFIFSVTVAFVIIGLHFHKIHKKNVEISRRIFFEPKPRTLFISDVLENDRFSGRLAQSIPSWLLPSHCYENYEELHEQTCLKWKGHAILDIVFTEKESVQCYNISWQLTSPKETTLDCFNLDNSAWFGPSNTSASRLSISERSFHFSSAMAKHYGSGTFSSVLDFYWLSSAGAALVFNSSLPINVSWNVDGSRQVCISMSAEHLKDNTFSYHMCNGASMMDTHQYIHRYFFRDVKSFPDQAVLANPLWSSLDDSRDKQESQASLVTLAKNIQKYKLPCSTIGIDGKWEANYGDLTFSKSAFPNMTELIEGINAAECTLSLKVFPYFDTNSTNFRDGLSRKFFVKAVGADVPSLVKWQHGVGSMLDVSNPLARAWVTRKLMKLVTTYSVKGFRLSYGSLAWLPTSPRYHNEEMSPNIVKRLFTELFSSLQDTVIPETSGSQHVSTLISVSAKHVVLPESGELCLGNLIPKALTIGILGYPFVISDGFDMRMDGKEDIPVLPSRDLYIRWLQLSAFFPAMRYTLKPWAYDDEIVTTSKNLTTFHQTMILPRIKNLEDEIKRGQPILRPLWWVNDADPTAFGIDDEFLLGNSMLVAPVLCENARQRDIYFPTGVWKDGLRDRVIIGPKWVREYQVGQFEVPHFDRQQVWGEE